MEIRISLGEQDFWTLVTGKELTKKSAFIDCHCNPVDVKIILSDIGFECMESAPAKAKYETQNKVDKIGP